MLREVDSKTFEIYAEKHSLYTFHQTKQWALLKQKNGWTHIYLLYEKAGKQAGALLLFKTLVLGKKMCYSPRGFLMDYQDTELLEDFTAALKTYLKKKNAIFVKIDPPVLLQTRDVNGDVIKGVDNHHVVENLKKIGYRHYGYNLSNHKELQPRWIFALPLDGKSEEDLFAHFDSRTKRSIKKCEKEGVIVEKMKVEDLAVYKKIMEHTSSRRGFLDRPLSYYQNMLSILKEHCYVLLGYLDVEKSLLLNEEKIEEAKKKKQRLADNADSKKAKSSLAEVEKQLEILEEKKTKLLEMQKTYGSKVALGGSMFLQYGNETTYLFGGSYQEFMQYPSQYLIQWKSIQMAKEHGCTLYNFYGIDGYLKEQGEMHGVYEFKRGFDGEVREYIGEFDLPISNVFYSLYKLSFQTYKKLKNLKNKKKH